tara:strand:- start:238 stop:618 length:381 start_codon:yes stop_codon:yes gene_type:complete
MDFPEEPIEELVKGETPTLLEAEKGNELIRILNKLGNLSIDHKDGRVVWTDDGVVLSWKEYQLPAGTVVVKLIDGFDIQKQWEITYVDGDLFTIEHVDSDWEELDVEICVDGSAVERTFLVKRLPE